MATGKKCLALKSKPVQTVPILQQFVRILSKISVLILVKILVKLNSFFNSLSCILHLIFELSLELLWVILQMSKKGLEMERKSYRKYEGQ
jgi:hypothetical protein